MRPWRRATRRGCPQKARTPRKSFVLSGTHRGRFRPWPRKASSRSDGRLSPTGRADSRTLELRCALLHEGLDSFVNVVRRGDEAEGHRLHLEGRIDGRVATAIQERLRQADRDGRLSSRSEEHTSELQSLRHLVCRLLLEKKKKHNIRKQSYNFSSSKLSTTFLRSH